MSRNAFYSITTLCLCLGEDLRAQGQAAAYSRNHHRLNWPKSSNIVDVTGKVNEPSDPPHLFDKEQLEEKA